MVKMEVEMKMKTENPNLLPLNLNLNPSDTDTQPFCSFMVLNFTYVINEEKVPLHVG